MTTKILALTDALGDPVRSRLVPGQRSDSVGGPPLIDGRAFDGPIADRAFDGNAIPDERGATRAWRTGRSFEAMIHLAAAVIDSRWVPTA